ncbi:hypothetical protein F4777DRAFT_578986 [Nemania sp. FL0916]|nr:hypothetical protein F4777DRAFT_578986 [Nemania sp. FL0916]
MSITLKLFALLVTPLAALAAPSAAASNSVVPAAFVPGDTESGPFNRCSTQTYHKNNLMHTADMMDCLAISEWAKQHHGIWILHATTTTGGLVVNKRDDHEGWYALRMQDNCALLVKSNKTTTIGNQDVVDLIESIHLGDGIGLGPIEEVGVFGGCQDGVDVELWLRDPKM